MQLYSDANAQAPYQTFVPMEIEPSWGTWGPLRRYTGEISVATYNEVETATGWIYELMLSITGA